MTVLLIAALIPPFFLLFKVYHMDKVEKEPANLIVKLFLFGALTVIPAALIESFALTFLNGAMSPYSVVFMLIENFICVALVEEGVKYVALKLGSWKHPAFDYCFDGVVYAVTVSLGFAAAENIMYVIQYGFATAVLRAVTAIPGHCIFGIFMGYYYGMAKYGENHGYVAKAHSFRVRAVIIPMLLHGFYDFCATYASTGDELIADVMILVFYAFIIVLDVVAFRSIKKYSAGDISVAPQVPINYDVAASEQVAEKPDTIEF